MAKHVLHFDGLRTGTHTWFYNCRSAPVRIDRGDWVVVDDVPNHWWRRWVESGEATERAEVPRRVRFLDENSDPKPIDTSRQETDVPPRGALTVYGSGLPVKIGTRGHVEELSVTDLPENAIEQIRQRYMPFELPGFPYVDARADRRAGPRVSTVQPPFELNFLVLLRLAWLRCRRRVEREIAGEAAEWEGYSKRMTRCGFAPEPYTRPARREVRDREAQATARVLRRWGVLARHRLPNRVTIYRQLVNSRLDVRKLDRVILKTWVEIQGAPPRGVGDSP